MIAALPHHRLGASLLATLALSLSAFSQTPSGSSADAVPADSFPIPTPSDDALWFDHLPDGTVWIAASGYKARVDAGGLRFLPFLGSDAPANRPIDLRLREVRIAGETLPLQSAGRRPERDGQRIELDHGTVVERFDALVAGVEQSFVFASLPRRGALVIDLAVDLDKELRAEVDGESLRFLGADGGVDYGSATALDAAGRRLPVMRRWTGTGIRIEVPAEFVATASLPLVVDPLIGPQPRLISANRQRDSHPDCCYDAATDRWLLVWQRDFSRNDADVWSSEYTLTANGLQPLVGSLQPLDTSDASWAGPSCANDAGSSRNLMVAQVSADGGSPWNISGRVRLAGSRTPAAPVELAGPTVPGFSFGDKTNPDVGGDPNADAPGSFIVVWEQQKAAPADRDIRARLYSANSDTPTPQGPRSLLLDGAEVLERNPSVSPSCGRDTSVPGIWFVVFQRLFTSTDDDIRLAVIRDDGEVLGAISIGVSSSPDDERRPQVSAASDPIATLGGVRRQAMVVWESAPPGAPDDSVIRGRLVRDDQLFDTPVLDITARAGIPPSARARGPQVDSDGLRYALGWTETSADTSELVRAMTLQPARNDVTFSEGPVILGRTDGAARCTSLQCAASGGARSSRYVAMWEDDRASADDAIFAVGYEGLSPGVDFTLFGQGCGGLSLQTAGQPRPGATLDVRVTGNAGRPSGQIWGEILPSPLPICPGCELLILGVALPDPIGLTVPYDTAIIGTRIDVQGFALGTAGSCLVEFTPGVTIRVR